MQGVKLSVIIVNYNVKYYLEQCLISLTQSLKDVNAEIFVVDNASVDGSVDYLSGRFPTVNLISSNHNLGFARANNLAIRQSKGEYVLLLNPDTIVGEHTMRQLIDWMDSHEGVGGVGVRMINQQGFDAKESRRGVPTPWTAFYKMCGLCAKYPTSKRFARYYMGHLPWNEPAEIEIVSGAFFAVPRKALEDVGLLDEDFFMYGEDIDLSYRLLQKGYHNWYLPLRILHYKGESTQKSSYRYVHVFYQAMLIFFKKHYGGMSILLGLPIKMAIYAKALVALVSMQVVKAKQGVGLFRRKKQETVRYVFIGSSQAMRECEEIARRKGLCAQFVTSTYADYPDGHLTLKLPQADKVSVVYDTQAYNFDQVLNIFASQPSEKVCLGTYLPETKMVITGSEILS